MVLFFSFLAAISSIHTVTSTLRIAIETTASSLDCSSLPDTGPCDGLFSNYFYNTSSALCEPFEYGGCQGNANNYQTKQECIDSCFETDNCLLPASAGFGRAIYQRYYYDHDSKRCQTFTFGGGPVVNMNNFETEEDCAVFGNQCVAATSDFPICGGFDHCIVYSHDNGCNKCECCDATQSVSECNFVNPTCESNVCLGVFIELCMECEDGYEIVDGQCNATLTTNIPTIVPTAIPTSNPTTQPTTARPTAQPTTERPTVYTTKEPTPAEIETCGGFAHCIAYTNGCNECSCRGSISFCGGKLCGSYGDSACTECIDEYVLIDGECQLDLGLFS